ncbi:hypothetical protein BDP27DRAFT_1468643 [Rhodocollybia butyracea]|uniref:Uncharacterized protein n=1 Tax=Rhodocollybia butyracea TaxID=206335 RepID=A0A9P5PMH5_9AGAR|nr:hypothetical protein BDP27DRAFT_1468643 [Rhodocollybia butyracea]
MDPWPKDKIGDFEGRHILVRAHTLEETTLQLEQGNFFDKRRRKKTFEKELQALSAASTAYSDSMEAHGRPNLVQTPCDPCDSKAHHLGPKTCGCGIESKVIQLEDGNSQTKHFVWTEAPPPLSLKKGCPVPGDWVLLLTIRFWVKKFPASPLPEVFFLTSWLTGKSTGGEVQKAVTIRNPGLLRKPSRKVTDGVSGSRPVTGRALLALV